MSKQSSEYEEEVDLLEESFEEPIPSRALEALGLTLMLAAVGLCFALLSFDPADRTGDNNLLGQLGLGLADRIFAAIGVVGYVAALFSVAAAGAALFGKLRKPSFVSILSGAAIVVAASVVAQQIGEPVLGKPPGGSLGESVGGWLMEMIGPAGSALATIGALVLGLMGLADASLVQLIRTIADRLFSFLYGLVLYADDRRAAWMAGQKRASEVRAAARMVDIPDGMVGWREDRRRAMVMRAEAAAEARVLQTLSSRAVTPEPVSSETLSPPVEVKEAVFEQPELSNEPALGELSIPGPAAASKDEKPFFEHSIENGGRADEVSSDKLVPRPPADGREPQYRPATPPSFHDPADVLERIEAEAQQERSSEEASISPAPTGEDSAEALEEILPAEGDLISDVVEADPQQTSTTPDSSSDGPSVEPFIHKKKGGVVRFDDSSVLADVPDEPDYQLPPLNLLDHGGADPDPVDQGELRQRATRLEEKLETYGVRGVVTAIRPGPVVTTYEYQPAPGVKVAKIANLQDDIAMSMEALRVRIVAPIPGRGVVGIELPNETRESVYLKEIAAHDRFRKSKSLLTLALGKDAEGDPQIRDLQKMPHLLVAGTTGSGKSVSINTMIISMLYKATPEQVKFIMVDPKMLELSLYNDIPHLLLPVVTDPRKASLALQWAVDEMERRYKLLSDFKVRDLGSFNKKLDRLRLQRELEASGQAEMLKSQIVDPWRGQAVPKELPYIVVLIDEFADLMTVAPRDVEVSVQRLAQKARAAGIHVLLATQRPSTDVITGVIKNNFPCRLAFRVASRHDSATIINQPGAEALLGRGDSLMMDTTSPNPARVHGSFVSEEEVERVVEFWKAQGRPVYDESILRPREDDEAGGVDLSDVDEHYDLAVQIVTDTRRASISGLQRKLRVGYNRAARMIEMMEAQGIVGPAVGAKGEREVLVPAVDSPQIN